MSDAKLENFQHWKDEGFSRKGLARWDDYRQLATRAFCGGANALRAGTRLWYVLAYQDVRAAYMDAENFSNSDYNTADELTLKNFPLGIDPPEHGKYRALLAPKFSPSAMKGYEARIRTWCRQLVEEIAPKGQCDFAQEFAMRYPTGIFLDLMGLPIESLPEYLDIVHSMSLTPTDQEDYGAIMAAGEKKIIDIFEQHLDSRRKDPKDDLTSYLLSSEVDGRPLNQTELLSICLNLFRGGLDTVVVQLGHIFMHLAQDPALRERIRIEPESIPKIIEEMVRYHTIGISRRRVVRDLEFAGCPMKAGDQVVLPLGAANRDTARFENPNNFDPDRKSMSANLAFAAGPHICVGMHLARLELSIALQEWHERIPNYSIEEGTVPRVVQTDFMFVGENVKLAW